MPRPEKKRHTRCNAACYYFKPKGIPIIELGEVALAQDEFEAIRLADLNEFFQEEAAARMNISRATFGRIIARAHNKIADAIINGKAIKISENIPNSIKECSKRICENCGKHSQLQLSRNKCKKCLSISKE